MALSFIKLEKTQKVTGLGTEGMKSSLRTCVACDVCVTSKCEHHLGNWMLRVVLEKWSGLGINEW